MKYKIKALREAAGLTQEELARKAGISRTILSGLESGTAETTTTKTLCQIASVLNMKVSDLFFEESV